MFSPLSGMWTCVYTPPPYENKRGGTVFSFFFPNQNGFETAILLSAFSLTVVTWFESALLYPWHSAPPGSGTAPVFVGARMRDMKCPHASCCRDTGRTTRGPTLIINPNRVFSDRERLPVPCLAEPTGRQGCLTPLPCIGYMGSARGEESSCVRHNKYTISLFARMCVWVGSVTSLHGVDDYCQQ